MTDMGMDNEVVPAMAAAIEARMAELKIADVADLVRRTGLSRQILGDLLAGRRKHYRGATTQRFCEAMRWRHDSVKRLLAGEAPIALATVNSLDEVARLLAELFAAVEELQTQVGTLIALSTVRAETDTNWPRSATADG